jgi:transposase
MEKLKIASATTGEATESKDVDAIFAEIEVLRSKTNSLEVENKLLREKINLLIRQKFGSRSEKTSANQLLLALELEPSLATEELTVELLQKPQAPRTTKPKKTTPRLPEDIPVEMVIIDPEEVKENPENFRKIGEEVSEELDLIPQRYILRKTVRNKYVDKCDKDRPPIVSPLGPRLLEGSLLSPGLLTDILMQKYVNHLPLHRLCELQHNR